MSSNPLSDQTLQAAQGVVESTQRAANQAVDSMGRALGGGVDRAREASLHLRDSVRDTANRASETTVNYIRHDPVKSVLIAAATGAALMALVSLLTRPHGRN